MRVGFLLLLICPVVFGQSRTMALKDVLDLALRQNPDLMMSRLDEQRSLLEIRAVSEPMIPRVIVGSGLAYTNGFPSTIDGQAPSIVQARATRGIYNAPQSYMVAKAKEDARGASLSTAHQREEIALKTANLYLDLERTQREIEYARHELEALRRIQGVVKQRITEGRELPIEGKRADVNLAHGQQRIGSLERSKRLFSQALSTALGLPPGEQIEPTMEERPELTIPNTEEAAVDAAFRENKELQQLESKMLSQTLEAKSYRANRKPKVDLLAQYSMLARFNNYDVYFAHYKRDNVQVGMSVSIPLFPSSSDLARASQADVETQRARLQLSNVRSRVENDSREAWRRVQDAQSAWEVSKLDLDLARDQVSVLLAQSEEGRVPLKQIEEAKFAEEEKWILFYDARYTLEKARMELLKQTHQLEAALR